MNSHVQNYYRRFVDQELSGRPFCDVIALHEDPSADWNSLSQKVPLLPKGWFELSQLQSRDRIEFCKEFWLETLPFVPHVHNAMEGFFSTLDDVGIFLTQQTFEDPYLCEIVYSLRDGSSFFHGGIPCSDAELRFLDALFHTNLPADYLAFLKIHDGFSKCTDTGLIPSNRLKETYQHLNDLILESQWEISWKNRVVDPSELIPFYQSFGLESYQCFYLSWDPLGTAGNIFCSVREKTISGFESDKENENLSFPSFLDWLIFYLERIGSLQKDQDVLCKRLI